MSYGGRYHGGGNGGRRLPPKIANMISLKVDNLTFRTTEDELKKVFERYGEVGDVYIPRDRFTQESRGFAFVRYYEKRDAEDALDAMDGRVLDGRELRVQMARYGPPNSTGRYGGGRRNYGRSYGRSRSDDRRRSYSRSRSRSKPRRRSYSRSSSYSSKSSGGRKKSRSDTRSPVKKNHDRSKSRS